MTVGAGERLRRIEQNEEMSEQLVLQCSRVCELDAAEPHELTPSTRAALSQLDSMLSTSPMAPSSTPTKTPSRAGLCVL